MEWFDKVWKYHDLMILPDDKISILKAERQDNLAGLINSTRIHIHINVFLLCLFSWVEDDQYHLLYWIQPFTALSSIWKGDAFLWHDWHNSIPCWNVKNGYRNNLYDNVVTSKRNSQTNKNSNCCIDES